MFKWESTDFDTDDDADLSHAASFGDPEFPDSDPVDTEPFQEKAQSDALAEDEPAFAIGAGNVWARHRLLSAKEEVELGRQLTKAFQGLQTLIIESHDHRNALIRHIRDELWTDATTLPPEVIARFDTVITQHDVWCADLWLASNDASFQRHAQDDLSKLQSALSGLDIAREWLLARAAGTDADTRLRTLAGEVHRLRNLFVSHNLRLVYHVARRHNSRGIELDDLIQEGTLGLFQATLKFDPESGNRFSTYAYWWIMQYIRKLIARDRSLIPFPVNLTQQTNKLHAYRSRFYYRHGRWPEKQEISAHTGIEERDVDKLLDLSNYCVSANSPVHEESAIALQDVLSVDDIIKPPQMILEEYDPVKLTERYLAELNEREARIVRLKFGLDDDNPGTYAEIGKVLGLTGERIRQIEREALRKLTLISQRNMNDAQTD